MIDEMTLSKVVDRLQSLEDEVNTIKTLFKSQPPQPHFEYIIRVDGQEVWRGLHIEEKIPEILRENPDVQMAIDWNSSPITLI